MDENPYVPPEAPSPPQAPDAHGWLVPFGLMEMLVGLLIFAAAALAGVENFAFAVLTGLTGLFGFLIPGLLLVLRHRWKFWAHVPTFLLLLGLFAASVL